MTGAAAARRAAGESGAWAIRSDAHGEATWGDLAEATLRLAAAIDGDRARPAAACAGGRPQPPVDVARPRRRRARRASLRARQLSSHAGRDRVHRRRGRCPAWRSSTRPRRLPRSRRSQVVTSPWCGCPTTASPATSSMRSSAIARRSSSAPDQRGAAQPAVHLGYDRPPEVGPAAAQDDRQLPRSGGLRRAHHRPPARQASDPSRRRSAVPQRSAHGGAAVAARACRSWSTSRFDAEATLAAIDQHRIESSIMVPTHFVRCLALPTTCATATTCRRCGRWRTPAASARSTSSGR